MRYCFLLLLMFASAGLALAQQPPSRLPAPPDSLRATLRAAPGGAARVYALLRVARAFSEGDNSAGALSYCQAAVALGQQLGDSLLVGQACEQRATYCLEEAQFGPAATWLRRATPLLRTAAPAVRARLEYHLAWLSEEQEQPKLAQRHYRQAINLYRAAHQPAQEAESALFLGRLLQNNGQFDSAMVYIFRALARYQQVRDTASIAATMTNVASILTERNDVTGANLYLKQAYRLGKKAGDPGHLIHCLNDLAINASYVDSMDLYYRYMEQSLVLSRQQHLPLNSNQYDYLGHVFEEFHPDSAIFYCLKGIRQGEQAHETTWMRGQSMVNLAFIYQRRGQAVPAAFWARKALALQQPYPAENYAAAALSVLRKQARARHDYRLAYELLAQETKLRVAVEARRHTALTERVRARYEVGQAEQQVLLLQQDQELARLRRQQEWAGGLGLLTLVLGTGGWSLTHYRRRQRGREAALRTRLAADLHDDVGSLLTQISLESSWLGAGSRSPEQLVPHLAHLADASRRAVQQLSDVVWGIDARNDDTGRVLEHMRDHAHEVLSIANLEVDFAADPTVAALLLPQLTRQNLYLIYKEALHNVVKHAQASLVTVRLRHEGSQLVMLVQDDGRGYLGTGRPGGQGLRNMQARAEAVGGTATYEPQNPGFGVVVRLPL